jgi:hypothetical protein
VGRFAPGATRLHTSILAELVRLMEVTPGISAPS